MGKPLMAGAYACQRLSFGISREGPTGKARVANRIRVLFSRRMPQIRLCGMTRGAYGNVDYGGG
ncbi:MAG: hypothetical protein JRJ38_20185 [Deltaproteobacteria bacterium]|nr:hypothetical protein [Deltaproteobacteria bacterium]